MEVSIHTPTQGVTLRLFHNYNRQNVSIHTPTQGVTATHDGKHIAVPVSIHTPTQGVTSNVGRESMFALMFQSTHPRRV